MRRTLSTELGWLLSLLLVAAMSAWAQTAPRLLRPSALAYDAAGDLFVADANLHQVFEATVGGQWKVVAGTGTEGFGGDGAAATLAQLDSPAGLVLSSDGTLYIADTGNQRIRFVGADGVIHTLAGDGRARFSGDGGPALAAALARPSALALDAAGGLLVCDTDNHRLRRIDLTAGTIVTVAGDGVQGFAGDGGPAISAALDSPGGVAAASDGRIYVADTHNARVRAIGTQGTISTFAGTGARGYGGDGGAATQARLFLPRGLALDATGALLIADTGNQRVRRVDASGVIATVAGSGIEGAAIAGDAATTARMRSPSAIAVSPFGWPAVADALNAQARVLVSTAQLYVPAALAPSRTDTLALTGAIYGSGAVQVQVSGEGGAAAGAVSVAQGAGNGGTAAVTGGSASVAVPQLAAGSYPVMVTYSGDGIHPAWSGPRTLTVAQAPLTASASPAVTVYGQTLPLLTGSLTGVLPQDNGQVTASFSTAAPVNLAPAGLYPIQASLAGTAAVNYTLVSQTAGELTVQPAPSRAAMTAGTTGGYAGMPLALEATVASTTQGQPTGMVSFLDGGATVATATLIGGAASAIYPAPPAGTRTLMVQYAGDQNFKPSVSGVVTETVGDLPDFSLAATGSTDQTVTGGGTLTYSFIVAGSPGPFSGSVLLNVGGLQKGAKAVFSPVAVIPGSSSATVTMTVTTVPLSASARQPSGALGVALAVSFGVVLFVLPARRRWSSLRVLRLPCLLLMVAALSGCGARVVDDTAPGLSPQSLPLVVTGTGTNLLGAVVTHSVSVTLHIR